MALRVLDQVWHPEAPSNADGSSVAPSTAVLLDGAVPSCSERVSSHGNDAIWLVRRFLDRFAEHLARVVPDDPRDVPALVESTRLALAREYDELCRQAGVVPAESPSACLAIAHDAGDTLELFNLGDLTTLVRGHDAALHKLGESAVRELDRQAIELLVREIAAGIEPHAARLARVRPILMQNRALRNQFAGYDLFEPSVSCSGRFERLSRPRGRVRDVLLMSDGFYRLVDTFGRYTDGTLFDAVERRGLAALLEELRALELDDAECTAYPRFKTHDDATALWLTLE
jgi:hypothetical protein